MDLKHKGISWVGNMFQKFEAVCQEVDNIISQDTVRYVENQVGSASENVKKLYSGVVQGLLPPGRDTLKCEGKNTAQIEPINACFKTPSLNEGENADHVVVYKSSEGQGTSTTDQIDNCTQASCEVTNENDDVVQISKHSFLELNADFPSQKNDDVNELLSGKTHGSLTDKLAFMESDANDPLLNSLRNTSSEINDTNKSVSSICDDSDLQLEDDVPVFANNDVVLTHNDERKISEEDTATEFDSYLTLESSRLSKMKLLNLVCSDTNFLTEEADDLNSLLMVELIPGITDRALIEKDLNECPIKDVIFEYDPSRNLLILPSHGNGVGFANEEDIMVSDSNHPQLEPELHVRMIEDSLSDKFSNGSTKEDTVLELEHDACYPLKNQTRYTSSCIEYKNEEVSSDSNDYCLKLESEFYCGRNSEALIDKASDGSCKEQANFELSTKLIHQRDKETVKGTVGSPDNECREDIVTPTEGPLVTSIHGVDVESTHNSLENVTDSSNAPDAEMGPVSSLKSIPKNSFLDSKSFVKNLSSCSVVHEKPSDQLASIKYESRPCFDIFASASNENKALKTKFVSSRSSLSSMESLGTHASNANESAVPTSRKVPFSEAISSGPISLSTELGCSHDSRFNIVDAEMETVDLGATLKPEYDIVDYKALHAVSCRTQKLRSYRKRIQDAFNYKKRLTKEYEHLAILYGDIDVELGTDSSPNASAIYASDSEWELL